METLYLGANQSKHVGKSSLYRRIDNVDIIYLCFFGSSFVSSLDKDRRNFVI